MYIIVHYDHYHICITMCFYRVVHNCNKQSTVYMHWNDIFQPQQIALRKVYSCVWNVLYDSTQLYPTAWGKHVSWLCHVQFTGFSVCKQICSHHVCCGCYHDWLLQSHKPHQNAIHTICCWQLQHCRAHTSINLISFYNVGTECLLNFMTLHSYVVFVYN